MPTFQHPLKLRQCPTLMFSHDIAWQTGVGEKSRLQTYKGTPFHSNVLPHPDLDIIRTVCDILQLFELATYYGRLLEDRRHHHARASYSVSNDEFWLFFQSQNQNLVIVRPIHPITHTKEAILPIKQDALTQTHSQSNSHIPVNKS